MIESSESRRKSGRHGQLTVTRRFDDALILRLADGVDEMLLARDLFDAPIRVTVMRGRASGQVRVGVFADRRINIVREEIAGLDAKRTAIHHRDASLAQAFMASAQAGLDAVTFQRLLHEARDSMQAEAPGA